MIEWLNTVVQGVLLGGLYALFAAGLSLIFGVMRLVNIAHGDLIVLAAYMGLTTTVLLGVHPALALVIVMPLIAALGYILQRGLLNHTLGDDILPPLLVTFGLSVIIQNAARDRCAAFADIRDRCCNHRAAAMGVLQHRPRTRLSGRVGQPGNRATHGLQQGPPFRTLWGTLAGGIILGVAQTVGGKIDPGFQLLAGHIVFLLVLAVRPNGLFPRVAH